MMENRQSGFFFHLKELPIIKNYTTGYGTEVSTRLETGLPDVRFHDASPHHSRQV